CSKTSRKSDHMVPLPVLAPKENVSIRGPFDRYKESHQLGCSEDLRRTHSGWFVRRNAVAQGCLQAITSSGLCAALGQLHQRTQAGPDPPTAQKLQCL